MITNQAIFWLTMGLGAFLVLCTFGYLAYELGKRTIEVWRDRRKWMRHGRSDGA